MKILYVLYAIALLMSQQSAKPVKLALHATIAFNLGVDKINLITLALIANKIQSLKNYPK